MISEIVTFWVRKRFPKSVSMAGGVYGGMYVGMVG